METVNFIAMVIGYGFMAFVVVVLVGNAVMIILSHLFERFVGTGGRVKP